MARIVGLIASSPVALATILTVFSTSSASACFRHTFDKCSSQEAQIYRLSLDRKTGKTEIEEVVDAPLPRMAPERYQQVVDNVKTKDAEENSKGRKTAPITEGWDAKVTPTKPRKKPVATVFAQSEAVKHTVR
ncbi:hypothetical protein SAMN04488061_2534 [Filomicrobium insigne]|uniref:Uncharacterized protein n=1 Tax=Filomicrobium insigne TaxID=418854 RepID=A0A1H0QX90_9HYPH|nr:hypothetical protein [Filomicrobium insigne]SDP21874.1 hypothetical protein SAMN04488061_2534 [Filomicrobium insigne]